MASPIDGILGFCLNATEDKHPVPLPMILILHPSGWAVGAYELPRGIEQLRVRFLGPSLNLL